MKVIEKNGMEFIKIDANNIEIYFSTAKNNISYKLAQESTKRNIFKLADVFEVEKVNYTNQIHSDIIIDIKNETSEDKEADGIITNRPNEIIGVFAADCIPVIIYDEEAKVIAAVHSGWKGTIADISKKACEKMKDIYGCKTLKVVIGPGVGQCCYEVSEELIQKFKSKYGDTVAKDRMLNLKEAIKIQLKELVKPENIMDLDICTNCNDKYELHSYRRDKENSGRLFGFAYIK
ncbi:MAG: peptidoglycan editing factor PgeF [Sarcina sp.]